MEDTLLLSQYAHALLPTHPGVKPGSGSGLRLSATCQQLSDPAAHALSWAVRLCVEEVHLVLSEHLWYALEIWLSALLLSAK